MKNAILEMWYFKTILLILFVVLSAMTSNGQATEQIGHLKFKNCNIKKTSASEYTIAGAAVKMTQLKLIAKTRVQTFCSYGNPAQDKYKTVNNKIVVSYAYDSTGVIYDSIISEIRKYVAEKEEWAIKYNGNGNDLTPFNKSFFVNDTVVIPFISTDGETTDDYKIFYIDKQVYKFGLLERNGMGNISSFLRQNMQFIKDGNKLNLDTYLIDLDKVKNILARIN